MENLQELKQALESEINKNKLLEEKLRIKSFENELIKRQISLMPSPTHKLPLNRKDQESILIALEREEEYINNMLHHSLQRLVQEKIEIENALEQEQEFIVNTMSRQLAKALNDKFQTTRRSTTFESPRNQETEETITDSSFSSDSENSRDVNRGKQHVRILEGNLNSIKTQILNAKNEIKKCEVYLDKEMYTQLKSANKLIVKDKVGSWNFMSEGSETDRSSEFSCGSFSSRSVNLDTSLDSNAASRENSSTPKPRNSKIMSRLIMAGLNLALPFLIVNMGGEMIFILNQRLLAQKIPVDKADKVRSDVIRHLFSEEFIRELLSPQGLYSMTSTRQVFDKIAQSSIMKLQTSSMNKLFDLMLMGVKMQILNLAYPEQLLKLTLNHIQELIGLTTARECVNLLNGTSEKLVKVYANLGSATFNRIKQALLRFFQNRQVKVTMFLHNNLQLNDGTLKIPTAEGVPQSETPGKVILGKIESHKTMLNTQKFKRSSLSTRHPLQANTALGSNLYDSEKSLIQEEETKINTFSSTSDRNRGAVAKWELDSLANMIRAKDEEPESVNISLFNDIEIEVKDQAYNEIASIVNNSHIQKLVEGLEEKKESGGPVEDADDELLGLL